MERIVEQPIVVHELKRGGVRSWLSLVVVVIKNWFAGWMFFLPNFVLSFVSMFSSAAIFYLMGQLVAKGVEKDVAQYGVTYGSYIVTGVMFNLLMRTTMSGYHDASLDGYWKMEFDMYLQHPGGVSAYLIGSVVAKYILAILSTLIYLLVGIWIFKISIMVNNLPSVVLLILIAILSLTGLGLAGASTFSLLNVKARGTNPLDLIVSFGVMLLSGVYFPPTVLPAWLQGVAEWLPQTHALRALRLLLAGRATLGDAVVANDIIYLLKFTVVALPIGILLFAAGLRKAQRDGNLTRWT